MIDSFPKNCPSRLISDEQDWSPTLVEMSGTRQRTLVSDHQLHRRAKHLVASAA
jgi:hypothetical protein